MPIFTAVGAAIFGAGTFLAAGTAFVLQTAAGLGLSYLAQALSGKKQNSEQPGFSAQGVIQTSGVVPRSFIFGKAMTAGSLVYVNTWGDLGKTPNAFLTQVIALSDLPSQSLDEVWVNGARVTLSGTPDLMNSYPVLEYYKDGVPYLWVKFYDGTQVAADPFLPSLVSSVDRPYEATRVGTGITYVIVTARVNDTLFSGFPSFKFVVTGTKLYDITKDTTAGGSGSHRWDTPSTWGGDGDHLPAVQLYNLLRGITYGGEWFYGLQAMVSVRLPPTNWIAQIGNCRTTVTGPDGAEPTYRAAGEIVVGNEIGSAVETLLSCMHGRLAEIGGFYKLYAGAPGAAVFSFTDDDILSTEEQSFTPFFGLHDSINGIEARYPSPANGWNYTEAPVLLSADYEEEDNNRRLLANVSLDMVPYDRQVQHLMQSALDEARRARKHTIGLPPKYWYVEPGDIGEWTSVRNGYVAKQFRTDGVLDKANLDIIVDMTEIDSSDYGWNQATDYTAPVISPTTYVVPEAQDIEDFAVAAGAIYDSTGLQRRPAIILSWDGDQPDIAGVEFEVRLASSETVVLRGRTENYAAEEYIIGQNILPNMAYEVRGRYIPNSDRITNFSDWLPVTTLDIFLSLADFEANLTAYVTTQLRDRDIEINKLSQRIAALAAEQDGANWLDKKDVRRDIRSREGVLSASIETVETVAVNTQSALASFQQVVTAGLAEKQASIETNATAIADINDGLAAQWTVTLTVDNYVSGLKSFNDGSTSDFTIITDSFRVVKPGVAGGDPKPMFQIADVEGVPTIVIAGDFFADGIIAARHLNVATLSAIVADVGLLNAGVIQSTNGLFVIDLNAGTITGYRP